MPMPDAQAAFKPAPVPLRMWTISLAEPLVDHLDSQARRYGCSRSAYLRRLVVEDLERGQR
jgi:metal-responsive CopG/Arc/MetJ family transcriptional regulator